MSTKIFVLEESEKGPTLNETAGRAGDARRARDREKGYLRRNGSAPPSRLPEDRTCNLRRKECNFCWL